MTSKATGSRMTSGFQKGHIYLSVVLMAECMHTFSFHDLDAEDWCPFPESQGPR